MNRKKENHLTRHTIIIEMHLKTVLLGAVPVLHPQEFLYFGIC